MPSPQLLDPQEQILDISDSGSDGGSDSDSPDPKRVDPSSHYDSNNDEEYSGAEELGHEVTFLSPTMAGKQ